jgi:hypothetical protein
MAQMLLSIHHCLEAGTEIYCVEERRLELKYTVSGGTQAGTEIYCEWRNAGWN